MKIGVVSNSLSRQNTRSLGRFSSAAARYPAIHHRVLANFAELPTIIEGFAREGIELLVINGGDGTVQAVLTELFERRPFDSFPMLAVLPGGTTNSIAADLGSTGNSCNALARLVAGFGDQAGRENIVSRNVLRVETGSSAGTQYGMFFATAGLCPAIRLRRDLFPQTWIPEAMAGLLTGVRVLCSWIFRGSVARRIFTGADIGMSLDDGVFTEERYTLLMVTTLARIYFNASPFRGNGDGGLKYSSIGSPARGLLRHLIPYLYGNKDRRLPEDTYRCGSADAVTLRMDCEFLLDGEFFKTSPGVAVSLRATEPVRFLRY